MIEQYISYFLPKSVTTVSFNKRKATEAYKSAINWLDKHTKYEKGNDFELHLTRPVNANVNITKIIKVIDEKYGKYKIYGEVNHYPDNNKIADMLSWNISSNKLDEVIAFTENNYNELKEYNCRIFIAIYFILLDKNQNVLPHQSINEKDMLKSRFYMHLEKNSSNMPEIDFPFSEVNNDFNEYYNYIKQDMPFKMNDKYLRICKKSKNGNIIIKKIAGEQAAGAVK